MRLLGSVSVAPPYLGGYSPSSLGEESPDREAGPSRRFPVPFDGSGTCLAKLQDLFFFFCRNRQ